MLISLTERLRRDQVLLAQQLGYTLPDARLEVQVLAAHACQVERVWLLAHGESPMPVASVPMYEAYFTRRMRGEPIAYIVGEREFYGHVFHVCADVLIPRPETELLVDLVLSSLATTPNAHILELGTGSGAIAISIALARPDVTILAVDSSHVALGVAIDNQQRLRAKNIEFLHSDWWKNISPQRFECIVSNPPYVAEQDIHLSQGDVRFEPLSALSSGAEGLNDLQRIIAPASQWLNTGAALFLEHGYDQGDAVRALLREAGLTQVTTHKDLAGLERVSGAKRLCS